MSRYVRKVNDLNPLEYLLKQIPGGRSVGFTNDFDEVVVVCCWYPWFSASVQEEHESVCNLWVQQANLPEFRKSFLVNIYVILRDDRQLMARQGTAMKATQLELQFDPSENTTIPRRNVSDVHCFCS